MLETLLQIGKTLRQSNRLRHHRYIKRAPLSDKKMSVGYFSLPVREDFRFELDNISTIMDEDFIKHQLFYLAYKSSDADSLMKYIWGDISYGVIKDKERGYYRMENPEIKNAFGLSSFVRGNEDVKPFAGTAIEKFRASFADHREQIENFLKEQGREKMCFLHFAFQGQREHWYEFEEELDALNRRLLDEFVTNQKGQIVLRKSLYKTLASPEKNLPFPNFTPESMYKAKAFGNADEVLDLLYAINYSTRAMLSARDIKIIILPKGENLTADQIEEFFEYKSDEKESSTTKATQQGIAEDKVLISEQTTGLYNFFDSLTPNVLFETGANIHSFDFIFSKAGGVSSPDVDMIELAGLQKSHLRAVGERIADIRQDVEAKRNRLIKSRKELGPLDVRRSFLNILGDVTTDKKKYQSHLLKVLPQIYADTYARDDLLLPGFVGKNEFNIRNEISNYNLLKFDYEFLTRLRKGGDKEMETMNDSNSYKAGKLLGQLAQPVSWEIKSFEKNYVGLLSRRISDKQSLVAFANFINEKLAIHERAYPSLKQKFIELVRLLSEISEANYHRDYCAFGFFEGYFGKPDIPVKASETTTESQSN
ncbi:MAG TPA: hypothetical protein VJ464_14910 [Blastocatellia bacterium]|nr:hypothetical protein [Blastocatellia bacterium]